MKIREVTLEEVLENRERRAQRQLDRIREYQMPVLSCTMNIPGEIKKTPLIDFVFLQTLKETEEVFRGKILSREEYLFPTGPEALWVITLPAAMIKEKAIVLEDKKLIGRLLDMDVIGSDGIKRSRHQPRTCLICGGPVSVCARSRAHGLDMLKEAVWNIMTEFAWPRLADLAVEALVREVELTPKPGLVDQDNSGAHDDMDLGLLLKSAESLRSYFHFCAQLGYDGPVDIDVLVQAGLEAERSMYRVTHGINTHRGAIYAFGLYLCALGTVFRDGGDVFEEAAKLAHAQDEASARDRESHGVTVTDQYQAGGAREEAMQGFPVARIGALALREEEDDAHFALLRIIQQIRDTNVLYRGGEEAEWFMKSAAEEILALPKIKRQSALYELDEECIRKNISPGGAADLLALAFLIRETLPNHSYT